MIKYLITLLLVFNLFAGKYYVRDGASGSNNGTDWTNAWEDMDDINWSTYSRGDTLYIADGSYLGDDFAQAVSSTTINYVFKATTAEHGTETGWNSAYGDGTANFQATVTFDTDYWILDGKVGSEKAGHGFKVTTSSCAAATKLIRIDNGADDITISHVEMEHCGINIGYNQDCFYCVSSSDGGSTNITLRYCYMHDVSRVMMLTNNFTNGLIEYCYFENRRHTSIHGEAVSANYCGANANNIFRYNIFENIYGTGILVFKDSEQSHFYVYGNLFFNSGGASYETHNGSVCNTSGDTNTDMYVYNNTFVDLNDVTGILWYNGSDNYATNNIWVNCATVNMVGTASSNNTTAGATSLFTNYAGDDFTLAAALAGVDLGSPYNSDLLGNTRGEDGTWDRGVYEYTGVISVSIRIIPGGNGYILNGGNGKIY